MWGGEGLQSAQGTIEHGEVVYRGVADSWVRERVMVEHGERSHSGTSALRRGG